VSLADQGELGSQSGFKVIKDRPALLQANGMALLGAETTDILLGGWCLPLQPMPTSMF
jgi:hypothetical protein